jgi:hypothetical protein
MPKFLFKSGTFFEDGKLFRGARLSESRALRKRRPTDEILDAAPGVLARRWILVANPRPIIARPT